jgi:hypothetical protein
VVTVVEVGNMTIKYVLLTKDATTKRTLDKPEKEGKTFTITTARGERPMILWYDVVGYMYGYTQHKDNDTHVHYYREVPSDDITELTPDA